MEKKTMIDLWQLLQPSETYDTRGRYEHCLRIWSKMDDAKQIRVFQRIADKLKNGEFVHPNPCFALDDALQEEECARAKQRRQQPTFLRGDEGGDLVQVHYNGTYKICTRQTALDFHLPITIDPW